MPKDARYRTAQKLFLSNQMKSLRDLFDIVDKTPLAKDMRTAPARLSKLINNPGLFTFDDCSKIAALLEVDEDKIIDLIRADIKGRRGRKGK